MTGLKLIDVGSHGSSHRSLAMPLLKTKAKRARAKDGEGISTLGMVGGGCFHVSVVSPWSPFFSRPLVL